MSFSSGKSFVLCLADFIGDVYQTFKEEFTLIFLKLFQNTGEKGLFSNSFDGASIPLILNLDKDIVTMKTIQHYPL